MALFVDEIEETTNCFWVLARAIPFPLMVSLDDIA
jgi:hypothetical protein